MNMAQQSFLNDQELVKVIEKITAQRNIDNITRTDAYFSYYKTHPEIKWSFLASMVSRNAGYNMCDLEGEYFSELLDTSFRKRLFLTYERANWLIFQDIYPQLLIYDYSTKLKRPLFHLLKNFQVSDFIHHEWEIFWEKRDRDRLINALIINEQNVIQKPVIEHHIYRKKVFHSLIFQFEDWFHFSSVLFPTIEGEVYGSSVSGFREVGNRIDLGKRLADILFQQRLYPSFYEFAKRQTHTGSRHDYEKFSTKKIFRKTPFLRTTFPIINHHIHEKVDWSIKKRIPNKWLNKKIKHLHPINLSDWYVKKQNQVKLLVALKQLMK